jgi:hypothetical protein
MKILILICAIMASSKIYAKEFRLETSVMDFSRNEIAIPGDSGDLFNTSDSSWKQKNAMNYRLYYSFDLNKTESIRILYAPLKTSFNGEFDSNVNFNGKTFNKGQATVNYQFNSYRIAYHKNIVKNATFTANYGWVAKIRDANIEVVQGGNKKSRKDLGFVPLFHLDARYSFNHLNSIYFDLDGLAAPQGRAFDFGLFLERQLLNNSKVFVGYRFIEGGADNDKVKTFSFINFYTLGVSLVF